jgi:alkylation response protein AidB-like acyl-CoA dehydrogenase
MGSINSTPSTSAESTEHLDTPEQNAFRLKARAYMKAKLPPRLPGVPAMNFDYPGLVQQDRDIQRALWDGGLAGITVPKDYGGQGLEQRFEDIFLEEAMPYRLPWHFGNSFVIVLPVLLGHGSEEQKKKYIPGMLKGEQLWAQLLSEPSGGSDLAGVLTRAELKDGMWHLNGSKIWTTGGHHCDMGLCLARTDASVPKHAGLTIFLVNMRQPGMSVQPIKLIFGESDFCQEFLDDVLVPDEDRVGAVGAGWTVAQTQLAAERAGMARGWNIGWRSAELAPQIELATRYADMVREVGRENDPIARDLIGEAYVLDVIGDLLAKRVAAGTANGRLPESTAIVTGLLAARTAVRRCALLSSLAGAAGVASRPGAANERIGMQRVTTHRIGGGTQEMQYNLVAERHLGLPREPNLEKGLPFNQLRTNAQR